MITLMTAWCSSIRWVASGVSAHGSYRGDRAAAGFHPPARLGGATRVGGQCPAATAVNVRQHSAHSRTNDVGTEGVVMPDVMRAIRQRRGPFWERQGGQRLQRGRGDRQLPCDLALGRERGHRRHRQRESPLSRRHLLATQPL
jgi:hypothetical protein